MLEEGARLYERAARRRAGRTDRGAGHRRSSRCCATPRRDPLDRWPPRTGARRRRPAHRAPGARAGHRRRRARRSGSTAQRALYGAWYEFFPRSRGRGARRARRRCAAARSAPRRERLPAVAEMGFDVVYLPPIHPIGKVNRKGPNTTEFPGGKPHDIGPDDPGSPWAIGSDEGGHDAIHPELGTIEDFDAFVARTRELGMEVALDFALQCAPDHPWATRAPGVVHHPGRRLDRLRREPAEEVPGHLPAQLRQRPRGPLRRVPAGRAALDLARRAHLPRRQPAHQAGRLLAVADRAR